MHIRKPFQDFHIYASWKHIIYVQYRISEFPPAVIYTIVKSMIDSQNETKSLLYKMQFFYKANILVFIRLQRNSPLCPILKFVIDKDLAQMQQNKKGGQKRKLNKCRVGHTERGTCESS